MGRSQGMMVDMIRFGCFQVAWDVRTFLQTTPLLLKLQFK